MRLDDLMEDESMNPVSQEEYVKLLVEVGNDNLDIRDAVDQFIAGGYTPAEFLNRMLFLRLQMIKQVDDHLESRIERLRAERLEGEGELHSDYEEHA
jgi:hypothetical protein